MDTTPGQLIVYRASRLEALLGPLRALAAAAPPEHVLAPVQIVAGHAGLRPWLTGALARAAGPGGIAANLDIQLPSSWLERLAQDTLGESAVALAPYTRGQLRWRIHDLLGDAPSARVQAYLHGSDSPGRRMQLAEHLAALFSRLIVYRPDWLDAWARGDAATPPNVEPALPWLWQRLRTRIAAPHRGERLQQLVAALGRASPARSDALHLFGLNHLAPSELAVFAAVARHRPVALYLPDPCRLDWQELAGQRQRLRQAVQHDAGNADAAFLEQDQPLLAAWGRLGQEFLLAIEEQEVTVDVRHWQDESDAVSIKRLARLQEGIRRLQPELLQPSPGVDERRDASLRVHACHTRLRELEVLRDALLHALVDSDDLEPSDIVVMAPDIAAYLPLLPAVFGAAGESGTALPYHLADVAVAHTHPLLGAFRRLLDLPMSRLPVPEVIDLLRVPQVAARFRLDDGGIERIADWLAQARVAWALDGAQRVRLGLPGIDTHTFAWGVDRLLATHVFGDTNGQPVALPDETMLAPLAGVEGPQAAELGALDALLVQLAAWQQAAEHPRRISDWATQLEARIDGLFRAESDDRAAQDALALLRKQIRQLADEPAQAGLDPELDYAAVRELLAQGLDAVPERQPFLLGGVTVCGMVPQRAIPFRVVAVLGLDDGAFPRGGIDAGLDPMPAHRRAGDRELRFDDRYLFLETVMSARERLHLSFIGIGASDGKRRNPAAPLAELLAELDRTHAVAVDGEDVDAQRPWLVQHPLQPFDARYFDGRDPALFTHRRDFAAMTGAGTLPASPFAALAPAPKADARAQYGIDTPLSLRSVLAYWKDPAKQLLQDGLKMRLERDDAHEDSEPLDAKPKALDRLPQRLFRDAIETRQARLPDEMPAWLAHSGLLADGVLGAQAWRELRDELDPVLAAAQGLPIFADGWPQPLAPRTFTVGRWQLEGASPDAYVAGDVLGVFVLHPAKKHGTLDFGVRIGLFLQWVLLRLDSANDECSVAMCLLLKDAVVADAQVEWNARWLAANAGERDVMRGDLQTRIEHLLVLFAAAQDRPLAYFPKTANAAQAGKSIDAAWAGGFGGIGERDYAPGYARLLAGDAPFDDVVQAQALRDIAKELEAVLSLDEAMP